MVARNARLALFVPLAASLSLACGRSSTGLKQALTSAPSLGTAQAFSVLGGQTVTNTGPTTMDGNLGVSPGSAVTGFPPGLVLPPSTIHAADSVAGQAQSDNTTAYLALKGAACNFDKTGLDLGGQSLTTGVYCFSSSAQLTGDLTLDAQGDANAVFIFQIVSTLTTATGSSVSLINGANPCNVFWQVGSSATIGTANSFVGNILALTSIALQTGTRVNGSALAQNGAVTLDTNTIRSNSCTVTGDDGGTPDGGTPDGGAGDGGTCPGVSLSCDLTGVIAGPPKQLQITVQDTASGLKSIEVTTSNNAVTIVPPFSSGSTALVVVTATKIDQSAGAQVALRVTNVCGNVTECDPLVPGDRPASSQASGCNTAPAELTSLLGLLLAARLLVRRRR